MYVDVLLGCDYFGLHPKQEEARCGDNLSIMSAALEICLQGTPPDLIEETKYDSNLAKKLHEVNVKMETYKIRLDFHPEFDPKPNPSILKPIHTEDDKQHSVNVLRSFSNRKKKTKLKTLSREKN